MMFWIIAIGLSLVASGFMVLPLLRTARHAAADRDSAVVQIFRDRLLELEEIRSEGSLSESEFDLLKLELEDSLLAETAPSPVTSLTDASDNHRVGRTWTLALAGLVPVLSLLLYSDAGMSLGAITDHQLAKSLKETDPADTTRMRQNVDDLRQQMERQPDNHQGWYLLANYLVSASQPEQGAQAYAHLVSAYPGDVGIAARYAETLFMADERTLSTRVEKAISRVQELQPMHTGMLELRGMAAAASGDFGSALTHFERALATLTHQERAGERGRFLRAAVAQVTEMRVGTTAADITTKGDTQSRSIQVHVTLSPQLNVSPDMPLFVYARAAGGPAMPLAVQRLRAADLPVSVELTEEMAMMPGMSLAGFDNVEVIARLSSSGIANASPDDVEARSRIINLGRKKNTVSLELLKRRDELGNEN